ncbi:MAG: NUDIX hydrolase, partial [Pseudomonadota bacterium]
NDGRLEILIIASSKNKHSVVPKGIQDPGHTPQASAAKEAWEEGGVEGVVAEEPLGSYRYDKWGAECTVTVYPMEVSRMVPEAEWEERHRGREWVSSGEAAARLKQRALAPMVQALAEQLTRKSHQPASGGSVTD